MSWWIFIHFYLWQNSLRRWWEQPLSLLSKLVVAGLLGLFGAFVILGLKNLGSQLDLRLRDRDVLTVTISETIPADEAPAILESAGSEPNLWAPLGDEVMTVLQAPASVVVDGTRRIPVMAVENLEQQGLEDDFYLLTASRPEDLTVEFTMDRFISEARTRRSTGDEQLLLNGQEALVAGVGRLSGVLIKGFTRTTVLHARSVAEIRKAHEIVNALTLVENKRVVIRSNLRILMELEEVRDIQARSLLWVTVSSSVILGLIFGSLAWMEFREERYLLSLIRSFGVGRITLLAHALMENCLLAVGGVLLGFGILHFASTRLNLAAVKMSWLKSAESLYGSEGQMLLLGAAIGGILACVPVAIGLRKPLGLVLK